MGHVHLIMKIAYLISAYCDPQQFWRMISVLYDIDTDFYAHIDKKVNASIFINDKLKEKYPNVVFIEQRFLVHWGGYNQVRYQQALFSEMIKSGKKYDRVFLLSGQDYPLMNKDEIKSFLRDNPQKEFIRAIQVTPHTKPEHFCNKITVFHFFRDLAVNSILVRRAFSGISRYIMTILPFRKKCYIIVDGKKWQVYQSSSYMCLTYKCVAYVLKEMTSNKRVMKYFQTSYVPEELVIPTIIMNSPYRANAEELKGDYKGLKALSTITYFNYGKQIQVFKLENYQELKDSNMMFARKMSSIISDSLMDQIDYENGSKKRK